MITKTYAPPPVEVKGPLEVAHMQANNNAHLHAIDASEPGLGVFKVSLKDEDGHISDYWYFDAEACDEAIEFFTLLRDDLNSRKDT